MATSVKLNKFQDPMSSFKESREKAIYFRTMIIKIIEIFSETVPSIRVGIALQPSDTPFQWQRYEYPWGSVVDQGHGDFISCNPGPVGKAVFTIEKSLMEPDRSCSCPWGYAGLMEEEWNRSKRRHRPRLPTVVGVRTVA